MKTARQQIPGPVTRLSLAVVALVTAAALSALAIGAGQRASAAGATSSGSAKVRMEHLKFKPAAISVARGTRVVFSNASKVTHNATLKGSFATGNIKPGKAVAVKFTAGGTYRYHCTIHPEMRGKIVVG
jgi:plastocyanin